MITEKLKRIILDQPELQDWPIDDATTAGMVPGWASLSHARNHRGYRGRLRNPVPYGRHRQARQHGQLQALVDGLTSR